MCESGSVESETKQLLAKYKLSSDSKQHNPQTSRWSQNIIEAKPEHRDQSNTRQIDNVAVNNRKKEIQRRYRERNRERLKQLEAERRKRIRCSNSIAGEPSISSNINRVDSNNIEGISDADSRSSSGPGGTQTSGIQRNEQTVLQKKREYQRIYREKNREVLKQREAQRRQRLRDSETITAESSNSSNMEFTEMKNEPMIDEVEVCQNDVKHLIQEVKKRPALWHMRSPLYYDRELKREGWSEIRAIFAYEMLEEQAADLGNSLQKKWKTLRDDFSRNFLQGKEDPVDYAEDLQFLKAAIDSKNPATKLNPNTGLFEEVASCETPSMESEEKRRDEEEDNRHFLLSLQGNLSTLPRDFNWKCRFELMQVLSIYNELASVQQQNPASHSSTHRQEQQQTNQNSQVLCVSIRNPENTSGTPDPQATTLISVENIDENSRDVVFWFCADRAQ